MRSYSRRELNTVTALAVDPNGTKVACHGFESRLVNIDNFVGFLFILDAATGALSSGLMVLEHDGAYTVTSAGFLLDNDLTVHIAFDHQGTNVFSKEQPMRWGSYNGATNTMNYFKEGTTGVTSCLVRGEGSYSAYIYMGGSRYSSSSSQYSLLISRIDPSNPGTINAWAIEYDYDCDDDRRMLWSGSSSRAAYIDHMAWHTDGSNELLFGTSRAHEQGSGSPGDRNFVWRVRMSTSSGGPSTSNYEFYELDLSNGWSTTNTILGISPTLEDSSNKYYMHIIYDDGAQTIYYARVTLSDDGGNNKAIQISSQPTYGIQAAWLGTASTTLSGGSNSFTGYEAYFVGSIEQYSAFQAGSTSSFTQQSYAVLPVFEDAASCHRSTSGGLTIKWDSVSCRRV